MNGFVYVIEWSNGTVKIGCTSNPEVRFKTHCNMNKHLSMKRSWISESMDDCMAEEKKVQSLFLEARIDKSELFKIDFDAAVFVLCDIFKELEKYRFVKW